MPFEWLHPRSAKRSPRTVDVYRTEIKERAAMLQRLNYSAAQARARIVANVAWDYEVGTWVPPVPLAEVGRIVDEVFARHGTGPGAPTV